MKKVLGLMVALVVFAAVPAIASAAASDQGCESSGGQANGCETGGGGGGGGGGGSTDSGSNASGNGGGGSFHDNTQSQSVTAGPCSNISQQQAIGHHIAQNSVQHNACVNRTVVSGNISRGRGFVNTNRGFTNRGVSGVSSVSGVSGNGGVQSVSLARTGFDAWIVALVGAGAMAGGLGLIAARRRGLLGL
jgi:LPXTG-motif cell wall-anchored protein